MSLAHFCLSSSDCFDSQLPFLIQRLWVFCIIAGEFAMFCFCTAFSVRAMIDFILKYFDDSQGQSHAAIESSIMLFMNHGCNGTYNYGIAGEYDEVVTETNYEVRNIDDLIQRILIKAPAYSPVYERNLRHILTNGGAYALRDIKEGEEILCDYLEFVGDPKYAIDEARS